MKLNKSTVRLSILAILTASALLLGGCKTRGAEPVPNLPAAFQIVRPGETVTYTCPPDCRYSIITTDKGLLYLQGLE